MDRIFEYFLIFFLSLNTAYLNLPRPTPVPTPTLTIKPTIIPKPTAKPLSNSLEAGIVSGTVSTSKGIFNATVLVLDMSQTKMITDSASDGDCNNSCPVLSLAEFVSKNNGSSGLNGTYFCPATYPECSSKTNSFDFPVYISRLNRWASGFALPWGHRRAIVYQDGSGVHYQHNSSGFNGGLSAGIINYPGLVDGGNVQIDENQSGLSDKQKSKNTKLSLCVVNPQKLQAIIAKNVTMLEFAHVNQALGCQGALNLDTGGSLAMYYNGRYIYGPGRALPNAVIFAPK